MPLKSNRGQGQSPLSDVHVRGRISWFGGPNDPTDSGHTANGLTTATPGIAVYNQATLGGYWKVTAPNGRTRVIQQTDIGPAPWTGRLIDFTYSALNLFGYSEGNFPTNATASAVYLGKDKQAAIQKAGGNAVEAAEQVTSGPEVGESQGAGKTQDVSLLGNAGSILEIIQDLLTGNITDLGAKAALASLQIFKDVGIGFIDLLVAPAWHWNQRATAFYTQVVINPKNVAEKGDYQWAFAWTAAFWGIGYVLLWTESDSGTLKPAPVHRSRLASHVRRAQALPARRSLIKPKNVKEHTPKKPPVTFSTAYVEQRGTMTTSRPRQVKVHGSTGSESTSATKQQSAIPVEQVATERPAQQRETSNAERHPQPHEGDTGRPRAHGNKRPSPAGPTTQGRSRRNHS
jgi:hypothetical protein